jgi:4-hydroxy-tetrahydrodipicolinate synthase
MKVFEEVRAEEQNGTNVSGVKSALALQGLDCGPVRPPSAWPLTPQQTDRLRRFMEQNNLIGKR